METSKMPLNVRRFFASFLLSLSALSFVNAQTTTPTAPTTTATTPTTAPPTVTTTTVPTQTTADVMRQRVSKAKAFIVVKNYNAAIYELENIRRETNDSNIHAMLNVLLMHSYLEQTDYKRAQGFLDSLYKDLKSKKPNADMNYYAAAGQIIKGAKNQLERYKSVGLTVSDRNLPLEALVDIDKMRETLETVINQSKDLGADKKQSVTALPLLEEAINARSSLAKDDYDANRWKLEVADAREGIINSRSTIINAVDGTTETVPQVKITENTVAANTSNTTQTPPSAIPQTVSAQAPEPTPKTTEDIVGFKPVPVADKQSTVQPTVDAKQESSKQTETVANTETRPNNQRQRLIVGQNNPTTPAKQEETKSETPKETVASNENNSEAKLPLTVGSLVEYATKRVSPVYPPQARTMRMTGVVKVKVTIDEDGKVAEVEDTDGPSLLQRSAQDAVKKWQFKPFVRNGQPTKATGFVNFNFTL